MVTIKLRREIDLTNAAQVERAYRVVSGEGFKEIGRGANGVVYRIDQDSVAKVFNDADALEDIRREQDVARLIRRKIRKNGMDTEQGRAEIANWKRELLELLDRTDTLTFD